MKKTSIVVCILLVLLVSCTSTKKAESSASENFYEKNAASFEMFTLDNGIELIYKKSEMHRVVSLSIMIDGGSALLDPSQSGLESMTMSMLTRGSNSYPYSEIQNITHETQSSIVGYSSLGYSVFSMQCIDYYFDTIFPIFADSFINPSFGQEEFTNIQNDTIQSIQQILNTPSSLVQYTAERTIYKDHPYETDVRPSLETIQTISLDNLKRHHTTLLNAKRIRIVASGSIDSNILFDKLNGIFGSIPSIEYNNTDIDPISVSGEPVVMTHQSAAGTGFLVKASSFPQFSDPDYIPAFLTSIIYSEILHNVVREKHGACYSIGNSQMITKSPYMVLYVHSASNMKEIPLFINEAQEILAQGNIIESKDTATGEFSFLSVEQSLEGYKNSLINSIFSTMTTTGGITSQIMGSLYLTGNKDAYFKILERIEKTSAEDIKRVFEKYWIQGSGQWFIVTGPDDVNSIPLDIYK